MVNYCVVCLHFHTLNFAVFTLMAIVVFIVEILRLSYWVIQKNKAEDPQTSTVSRQYSRVCMSSFFRHPATGMLFPPAFLAPWSVPITFYPVVCPCDRRIAAIKPILCTTFSAIPAFRNMIPDVFVKN